MAENTPVDLKIATGSNGTVCFASDVLATIAGLALTEIEGITNNAGFSALLAEKLSRKAQNNIKNLTRGIKVDVNGKDVSVTVTATLEYGYSVPDVSREIQEGIKKTIETMTGMNVVNVDVHVTSLSFEKEKSENALLEGRVSGAEAENKALEAGESEQNSEKQA